MLQRIAGCLRSHVEFGRTAAARDSCYDVLDYFTVFGEQHMDHIVSETLAYYHEERPHQAKGNDPLAPAKAANDPKKAKRKKDESSPDVVPVSQIECRQRLGGLLKHYSRKAA